MEKMSFRVRNMKSRTIAGLFSAAAATSIVTTNVHAAEFDQVFNKLQTAYLALAVAKECDLEWEIGPRVFLLAKERVRQLEQMSEYRPLEMQMFRDIAAEQAPMSKAFGGCIEILHAFRALDQQPRDHSATMNDQQQEAQLSTDRQLPTETPKESEPTVTGESRLPIAAGAYVSRQSFCDDLKRGELDMIDFEVDENMRSFSTGENSCVIGSIKKLSETRSVVNADCIEFGNPFQSTFMLDRLPNGDIRIDGDDHFFCTTVATTADDLNTVQILIEQWADEDENCRGGSGDDPNTIDACDRRSGVSARLERLGYCYDGDTTASAEWKRCQ
jgi:hypothetical protein